MNILFATGELNTWFSATNKIAYQIAAELSKKGHNCTIVGISVDSVPSVTMQENVKLMRLNSTAITDKAKQKLEKYCKDNKTKTRQQAKQDFMRLHPVSSMALMYAYSPFYKEKYSVNEYQKQIKKIIKKEAPDAIIVTYMPFAQAAAVFEIEDIKCPIYAYQTDPWGLHCLPELSCDKEKHIKEETAVFSRADSIITTPILLRQYSQDENYKKYIEKMIALDFPNIKKPVKNVGVKPAFEFSANYTNILFCGIIEDTYRSPENFLKAITGLENFQQKIRVYFLGMNVGKTLKKYTDKYPNNIFYHTQVSVEIAFETMQNSDILLNIGNTSDNQVPSKIFDYFSMGKPIINVQKINNCPSREYFEKYPLAFTFEDYNNGDALKLESFIFETATSTVEYQTVEQIFSTATLSYASEKISNILLK